MPRNIWLAALIAAMFASPLSAFAQDELRVVEPFQLQRLDTQTGGFQLRANGVTETLVQTNPEAAMRPRPQTNPQPQPHLWQPRAGRRAPTGRAPPAEPA